MIRAASEPCGFVGAVDEHIDEVHETRAVTGGEIFAIWSKANGAECTVTIEAGEFSPTRQFPQTKRTVIGTGDDVAAVLGKYHVCHPVFVAP